MLMKLIRTISIFVFSFVLIWSCKTGNSRDNQTGVDYFGHMHSIMSGNFSTSYSLDSIVGQENMYALGAMDSLAGELQIFDGQSYHSITDGDSVVVDSKSMVDAALLVYSKVSQWDELPIPLSVANKEALVGFLEYSEDLRIDRERPFVFLIEGVVEQIDWHVLNKPVIDSIKLGNNHLYNAAKGKISNVNVDILGVYSREHAGIYTHHNIPIHMHFKTSDGLLAGHIDDLELGPDMKLKIPKTK